MYPLRGAWGHENVAAFLGETAVPVRLACRTPGGGLWMLSLWFEYDADAGSLSCATSASADVVRYLRADEGVAFEVSTNRPPYRGVRGQGRATVEPDEEKALLKRLLDRYLGGTDSDLARSLLDPDREEVRIEVAVTKGYTWDYSDRMPTEEA